MNYRLFVNGTLHEAEVDEVTDEGFHVLMGKSEYLVSCIRVSDNILRLEVDGTGKNIYLSGEKRKEIIFGGREYSVEDAYEAERGGGVSRVREEPVNVTPPMPALVVKVLVDEGVKVSRGDPVVLISAMKLETTLRAPYAGTVVSVNTAEGEKVMPGDILIDIEKLEGAENHE
jgi:3-methylcrotonyl-CoA carboxylase alpha subunit